MRTAILIVNGFDRRDRWGVFNAREAEDYPWIELCLRQIERHSQGSDYEVRIYDNARLRSHRAIMRRYPRVTVQPSDFLLGVARIAGRIRPRVLDRLERPHVAALEHLVHTLDDRVEYFITLDSDAFPIADGWVEKLVGAIDNGAQLAGIYRDEMASGIAPFVHVSCLCMRRRDFLDLGCSFGTGQDVAQGITLQLAAAGERIAKLRRSNAENVHFLIGGVYGNLVYHHGAGSRHATFWTSEDVDEDEKARVELRNAVFTDLDGTIERLTGAPYGAAAVVIDEG